MSLSLKSILRKLDSLLISSFRCCILKDLYVLLCSMVFRVLAHLFVCFARSGFPICHIDVVVGRRRVVIEAYPGPFY